MSNAKNFKLHARITESINTKSCKTFCNLKYLFEKHPEMFYGYAELRTIIKQTLEEPEIIINTASNEVLAIKKLKAMFYAEIGIRNKNDKNIIFHANKKRLKEFDRLMDSLVETPAPSTHRDLPTEELTTHNNELSGANARSAKPRDNSTKELNQSQSKPKYTKKAR